MEDGCPDGGDEILGTLDGASVGGGLGLAAVGMGVVEGRALDIMDGGKDGDTLGRSDGDGDRAVEGSREGGWLGRADGTNVGVPLGRVDAHREGAAEGSADGCWLS